MQILLTEEQSKAYLADKTARKTELELRLQDFMKVFSAQIAGMKFPCRPEDLLKSFEAARETWKKQNDHPSA